MFVAPDATHVNYEKLLTYLSAMYRRALTPGLDAAPPPTISRAVNEPSPMDRRGTTYNSHFNQPPASTRYESFEKRKTIALECSLLKSF